MARAISPLNFFLNGSARHADASSSTTMKPTLCRLSAYSRSGLPSPTTRSIAKNGKGPGRTGRGPKPEARGLLLLALGRLLGRRRSRTRRRGSTLGTRRRRRSALGTFRRRLGRLDLFLDGLRRLHDDDAPL